MIEGFVQASAGTPTLRCGLGVLADAWARPEAWAFVDVSSPAAGELADVAALFDVERTALEPCPLCSLEPEVEAIGQHLVLVTYEAEGPGPDAAHPLALRPIRLVLGERFLVAVHDGPSAAVSALARRFAAEVGAAAPASCGALAVALLHRIVASALHAAERLKALLDAAEDVSLSGDADDSVLEQLGAVRQPLLDLHRFAVLQGEALLPLERGGLAGASLELCSEAQHLRAHLSELERHADGLRELSRAVRENYNAALANRMNRVMMTLTVFASTVLPLSLITGIYGMNVPLWPGPADARGLPFAAALMAAVTAGLLVYFRRRRFL